MSAASSVDASFMLVQGRNTLPVMAPSLVSTSKFNFLCLPKRCELMNSATLAVVLILNAVSGFQSASNTFWLNENTFTGISSLSLPSICCSEMSPPASNNPYLPLVVLMMMPDPYILSPYMACILPINSLSNLLDASLPDGWL